jgi:hypothetical protein
LIVVDDCEPAPVQPAASAKDVPVESNILREVRHAIQGVPEELKRHQMTGHPEPCSARCAHPFQLAFLDPQPDVFSISSLEHAKRGARIDPGGQCGSLSSSTQGNRQSDSKGIAVSVQPLELEPASARRNLRGRDSVPIST